MKSRTSKSKMHIINVLKFKIGSLKYRMGRAVAEEVCHDGVARVWEWGL
uniref:Uncharacterized protein n=1 Tax=Anguilla anguilla TaxID=7936 RepID=A0A0E9PE11_ANGAN